MNLNKSYRPTIGVFIICSIINGLWCAYLSLWIENFNALEIIAGFFLGSLAHAAAVVFIVKDWYALLIVDLISILGMYKVLQWNRRKTPIKGWRYAIMIVSVFYWTHIGSLVGLYYNAYLYRNI